MYSGLAAENKCNLSSTFLLIFSKNNYLIQEAQTLFLVKSASPKLLKIKITSPPTSVLLGSFDDIIVAYIILKYKCRFFAEHIHFIIKY